VRPRRVRPGATGAGAFSERTADDHCADQPGATDIHDDRHHAQKADVNVDIDLGDIDLDHLELAPVDHIDVDLASRDSVDVHTRRFVHLVPARDNADDRVVTGSGDGRDSP
jgi:hypothetical protein